MCQLNVYVIYVTIKFTHRYVYIDIHTYVESNCVDHVYGSNVCVLCVDSMRDSMCVDHMRESSICPLDAHIYMYL